MPYTKDKVVDTASGLPSYSWTNYRRTWSAQYGWNSTNYPSTASGTNQPGRRYNRKQWNVTASYKALLAAQGYLPTKEFLLTEWSSAYDPIMGVTWKHWQIHEYWDETKYYRTISRPSLVSNSGWPTTVEIANAHADSQHKTLAKARDMKVNLPVMFGEGRKTVNMLTDTAKRLGNAYLSFLRKDFKRAAQYLDMKEPAHGLARHWLAYQYGWRPLLSDAEGLSEGASEWLDETQQRPPRFTVTAKSDTLRPLKYSVANQFSAFGSGTTNYTGEVFMRARSGLLLETVFRPSAIAAQLGMSSVTDGLLLAWELVPFSFVFDWFLKVGQYLESASALSGYTVKAGYTRREIHARKLVGVAAPAANATYRLYSGKLNPITGHEREYYRVNWTGGQPSIVTSGLNGLLDSTTRLRSAAALFITLCSSDRKQGAYRP